ncbi:MAG: hypothetical protein L3J44_01275 [Campylobacteraceae bacterium]|nr:hypothetical protein [Campylobacteraceae bacterium]
MKKLILSIMIVISSFALEIPKNHIVSTQWLQANQNQKNLVIIDTRNSKAYKKGHIKNAVSYPKKLWFRGKLGDIPKLYNTPSQFQDMFSKAGITTKSIVVFYSAGLKNKDFADAASGVWTAWVYGFRNSVILNGGFEKYKEEKRAITSIITKVKNSGYEVEKYDKSPIASLSDILEAMYSEDLQITDARVAKFYRGDDSRKDLARHGRIPTARLTPVIRQVKKVGNHFEFLSSKEARATLYNAGFGIDLEKPLIIYCNTGHKARGLWFAAKFIAGIKNVRVFDGSMVEYSKTLLPIETGEPME